MAFHPTIDFVVKYDPEKDTKEDLTKRILYTLFIKRLKANKPVICFIGGDSGEGKSKGALKLQEILCELQGVNFKEHMGDMNVFTPLEYPQKLDKILFDKNYKKINILCTHEAREVVKAKNWHDFLTQSISDVNAMSRSIKRLIIIVISQFIRDITSDVRYTLTYYMTIHRGLQGKSKLRLYKMWKDDRDLEKPRLKKRRIKGYLVAPDGKYRRFIPTHLEITLPDKEICKEFDDLDTLAKSHIIRGKLDKLIQEMKKDIGFETDKIKTMVEWYTRDINTFQEIGKQVRGKWKVRKEIQAMHDLTDSEMVEFSKVAEKKVKSLGWC